jgi:hypothetical protein
METVSEVRTNGVPPVVPAERTSSPIDQVWDFFISVKLAIFTLIILAVASIFGTIVEQNQPPEKYHQIYEDWAFALMNRINLFDMYHSWWFLLLLALFTVNLACCTIDRFPKMLKVVRNPRMKLDGSLEKTLSLSDRWKKKGTISDWTAKYSLAPVWRAAVARHHEFASNGRWLGGIAEIKEHLRERLEGAGRLKKESR